MAQHKQKEGLIFSTTVFTLKVTFKIVSVFWIFIFSIRSMSHKLAESYFTRYQLCHQKNIIVREHTVDFVKTSSFCFKTFITWLSFTICSIEVSCGCAGTRPYRFDFLLNHRCGTSFAKYLYENQINYH